MAQAWAPARAASKQAKEHYSTMWQCAAATQTQCNLDVRTGGEDKVKWCTGYALYGTAGSHVMRTGQAPCGGHAPGAAPRAGGPAQPPTRSCAVVLHRAAMGALSMLLCDPAALPYLVQVKVRSRLSGAANECAPGCVQRQRV